MDRHLTEDQRSAVLMNLIAPEDAAQYAEHLTHCEACRDELARDRQILEACASQPVPDAADDRWNAMIRAAISKEMAGEGAGPTLMQPNSDEKPFDTFGIWFWRAAVLALVFSAGFWSGSAREVMNARQTRRTPGIVSAPVDAEPARPRPYSAKVRLIGMADDTQSGCYTTRVQFNTAISSSSLHF